GIPGITAHRAVFVAGAGGGGPGFVEGGGGGGGARAGPPPHRARGRGISSCPSPNNKENALRASAGERLSSAEGLAEHILRLAPQGVHHIVEVAFAVNVKIDVDVLAEGGSIATYATNAPTPTIPFWQLVFKNIRIFFLGSDDFPRDEKVAA